MANGKFDFNITKTSKTNNNLEEYYEEEFEVQNIELGGDNTIENSDLSNDKINQMKQFMNEELYAGEGSNQEPSNKIVDELKEEENVIDINSINNISFTESNIKEEENVIEYEKKEEIKIETEFNIEKPLDENNNSNLSKENENEKYSYDEEEIENLTFEAMEYKLVTRHGSYYEIVGDPESKQKGILNFVKFLKNNPDELSELKVAIKYNSRKSLDNSLSEEINSALNISNETVEIENITEEKEEDKLEIKTLIESVPVSLDSIHGEILNYVCLKTIGNLLNSYKSKMYTEEYTNKLFKSYIDGETDASNPLFKELINECVSSNVIDPYLEDLTIKVLEYIKTSKE